jgi:hypothetical protein
VEFVVEKHLGCGRGPRSTNLYEAPESLPSGVFSLVSAVSVLSVVQNRPFLSAAEGTPMQMPSLQHARSRPEHCRTGQALGGAGR